MSQPDGEAPPAAPSRASRIECGSCPVGIVSGESLGQFCPFIVRDYPEGAILYDVGQAADYIWFIRSGVVALQTADGESRLQYPNSFIGAEAVETGRYGATARADSPATLCGATREGFVQWMTSRAESVCAAICRTTPDDR